MINRKRSIFTGLALILLLTSCAASDHSTERREIVRHLYTSTLQILVRQPDGVRRTGSGVVIHADEKTGDVYVVTAAHVISDSKNLLVYVVGRFRRNTYPATVVLRGMKEDVAVIRTHVPGVVPAEVGDDADLGQDVWVVSYPWGRRRTLVTGIVSQIAWPDGIKGGGQVPLAGPIQLLDATAAYGTSGGGVFDTETGLLLGIVRGYRTVQIPIPGADAKPVSLPVGGETTVVSISDIRKYMEANNLGHLLPKPVKNPPHLLPPDPGPPQQQ